MGRDPGTDRGHWACPLTLGARGKSNKYSLAKLTHEYGHCRPRNLLKGGVKPLFGAVGEMGSLNVMFEARICKRGSGHEVAVVDNTYVVPETVSWA